MNNGKKKKEESNSKSSKIGIIEYEYCKVCRINHNKGAKHKYFPSHKNSISSFLSKSLYKISQIRFSLHNPNPNSLLDSHDHRFWCVFCDSDIIDQQPPHSAFPRSNAIHHLASIDHLKNLKHFMWKYGSGHFQIDAFMISQSDLAKWEKKCKSFNCESAASSIGPCLPDNNGDYNYIHNELNIGNITSFENNNNNIHSLPNNVMPLQYNTNEYQVSSYSGIRDVADNGPSLYHDTSSWPASASLPASNSRSSIDPIAMGSSPNLPHFNNNRCSVADYASKKEMHQGYLDQRMANGGSSTQGYQNLTQISFKAPEDGGNVHSGAPPPWFKADEISRYSVQLKPDFVSLDSASSSSAKSRKLNPKRVGAAWAERRKIELEKEKNGEINKNDYDAGWLPNFGRVWQSGSRKESRKEFEKEKDKIPKPESQSEAPIPLQPYISKRMRSES